LWDAKYQIILKNKGIIHVFENQNLKLFSLCFFLKNKISIILTKPAGFAFKKIINFLFEDRTKNTKTVILK